MADPNLPASIVPKDQRVLGTYVGVFQPTLLTIIGVILYLREGYVVGRAGLVGGLSIIMLTFLLTGATALSVSSITTNIRIGAGGAFAVVARSLGLEAGGAIGIPLYVGQALSIAFYMHGLSEAWLYLFPTHPRAIVLASIYALGFAATLISERFTLALQFVVLAGVVAAVGSIWAGVIVAPSLHQPVLLGDFAGTGYWSLFALFFPAGTGIMVGVSLSGKLRDPRRSIPRGVLGAWALAFGVYVATAIALSVVASPGALADNEFVAVDVAAVGSLVLVGLVCSCASATLGSMVAAPNVLLALAEHRLLPASTILAKRSEGGTPRRCVAVTGLIVGAALVFGNLDSVAHVITTTFLLTYATVNIVVAVEQSLAMISFRPTLSIPIAVPIIGALGNTLVLVQSEPSFGLMALVAVALTYGFLVKRDVGSPWETVRSGLVVALAHRVAELIQRIEGPQYRAWKPDFVVPVRSAAELAGEAPLLASLAAERGSVQVIALESPDDQERDAARLDDIIDFFRDRRLIATHAQMPTPDLITAVRTSAAVLDRTLFRPNVLFLNGKSWGQDELSTLADIATEERLGMALLMPHAEAGIGRSRRVAIWIRFQEEEGLTALGRSNVDLLVLLGYQLRCSWGAELQLVTAAPPGCEAQALSLLTRLREEARLPVNTRLIAEARGFDDLLPELVGVDLHLLGLPDQLDRDRLDDIVTQAGSTCMFVRDSGLESAFA